MDLDRSTSPEDVAIYCGGNWRAWSPDDLVTTGLNGGHTAAVRIAEGLARRGYATTIYGEGEDAMYGDVRFRPWQSFDPAIPRTAVSCFANTPYLFDLPINARVRILASHQPTYLRSLTPARAARIDYVTTVSGHHEALMRRQYPFLAHKVVRSRNGIDTDRFIGDPPAKRRKRVLFTSLPDRGLDALLDMWPRIRAQVPEAELAYSYSNFEPGHEATLRALLGGKVDQPGVIGLGTVPGYMYPDSLREAMVWAHPSWSGRRQMPYTELSCVAGMEAQAAGLHVVASAWGGLPETVRSGDLVYEPMRSQEWEDRFVASIVAGLTDPAVQARALREGPAAMADHDWEGAAADVVCLLEGSQQSGRTVTVRPASTTIAAAALPFRPAVPYVARAERRRRERALRRELRRHARRTAASASAVAVLATSTAAPALAAPTISFTGGVLTVAGDPAAPDTVSIGCKNGSLHLTAQGSWDPNDPAIFTDANDPLLCTSVTQINANGSTGGNTTFNLAAVTNAGGFTQPTPPLIHITGSPDGNDLLTGSDFNDTISGGGGGTDTANAGAGSKDIVEIPAVGNTVTLTPTSASTSDGHSIGLTGFDGALVSGTGLDETLNASAWHGFFQFDALGGTDHAVLQSSPTSSFPSIFNGGQGTDTVVVNSDFSYLSLTPTAIYGSGPTTTVSGLENADITGGPGPNYLDSSTWSRSVGFSAGPGNDSFFSGADPNDPALFDGGADVDQSSMSGAGSFAVTPSVFSVGGQPVIQQSHTERAFVMGSALNDSFDASSFTGLAFFDAGAGDDSFTLPNQIQGSPDPNEPAALGDFRGGDGFDVVFRTADQNFSVTDSRLANPGGSDLENVEQGVLTGGASANTFDINTQNLMIQAFGAGGPDVFNVGPTSGASLFGGPDGDTFNANNGVANAIDCGNDQGNVLNVDTLDSAAGCLSGGGSVVDANDPGVPPPTNTPPPGTNLPINIVIPATVTLDANGRFSFTVDCPAGPSCVGEGVLDTAKPVKASAVKKRVVRLGRAKFGVPGGVKTKVRMKLSKPGFKIVRKARHVRVKLTVTSRQGTSPATKKAKTFVLKAPKRGH